MSQLLVPTTIRLLGPPEIEVDGAPVAVHNRRAFVVLARVALASTPVSRPQLAAECWEDASAETASKNLRSVLSNLRHLCPDAIDIRRDRVGLGSGARTIDLVQVLDQLHVRTPAAGRGARRLEELQHAIALARGELLEGLDGLLGETLGLWLDGERQYVADHVIEAQTTLVGMLRRAGRHEEAIAIATDLVRRSPLRQASHLTLIDTQLEAGDRDGALEQVERCRWVLTEELGIDAPEALDRRAARAMSLRLGGETVQRPFTLPPATALIGRSELIDEITAELQLEDVRLVTLVGAGGVGKTSLAAVVAQRIADGGTMVAFVDLHAVVDAEGVFGAVARAIGVSGGYELETISTAIGSRAAVLVLDNAEHLVSELADPLRRLLTECPTVTVLATSRVPLDDPAEHVLSVPTLPFDRTERGPSPAVELFLRTARRRGSDVDGSLDAVEEVCRWVDGLPLAIELAAAQVRALGLEAVRDRLTSDDVTVLRDDRRPGQHRDLETVARSSIDLLDRDSLDVLAASTLFPGPFTTDSLRATAWAAIGDRDVHRSLLMLVDVGFLRRHLVDGRAWFELVPALAAVARAVSATDAGAVRRRIDHDCALVSRVHAATDAPVIQRWYAYLDLYEPTLRDSIDHLAEVGDPREVDVVGGLAGYWLSRCRFGEALERLTGVLHRSERRDWRISLLELWEELFRAELTGYGSALDLAPRIAARLDVLRSTAPAADLIEGLEVAVHLFDLADEAPLSDSLVREGIALAERIGDRQARMRFRYSDAMLRQLEGDLEETERILQEVIDEATVVDDRKTELQARMLASLSGIRGPEGGRPSTLEELRELALEAGEQRQVIWITASLAAVSILDGRFADAGRWGLAALDLAESSTYHLGIGFALMVGAASAALQGDLVTGGRLHGAIDHETGLIGRSMPRTYFDPYLEIAGGIVAAGETDETVGDALDAGRQVPRQATRQLLRRYLADLSVSA